MGKKSNRDTIYLDATVDFHAADGGGKDKVPTFSVTAYDGDVFQPSNWPKTVVDLAGLDIESGPRPVLLDHDPAQRVGHCDVALTAVDIKAHGSISGAGQAADEVMQAHAKGFPWRASIGLQVEKKEQLGPKRIERINGRTVLGPMTVVRAAKLHEISFLGLAADNNAVVNIAAGANNKGDLVVDPKFNEWLTAGGWDIDQLSDGQLKTLQASFDVELAAKAKKADEEKSVQASLAAAENSPDIVADIRKRGAVELTRINEIDELFKDAELELKARAVSEGWDLTKCELELLRAQRSHTPAIHVTDHDQVAGDVLHAACCVAGGLADCDKEFEDKTLQAAHDRFRRNISLQELLLEAAWGNNYHGLRFRGNEEEVLRAAFSTQSLPGILGNTANKFLLEGFGFVESVWQSISSSRSVSDFKTVTSYRLTGDMQFLEVGPAGELKHTETSEESFTNQAKTYGRMYSITRQDQINDDLGALTAVPRKIGRGAGLKLNDIFWTEFLANSSFFTAGNNNYFEGASTNLQSSSLATAVLNFRKQTDPDGKPVAIEPRLLLIPPDIEVTAEELFVSTNYTGGSSKTPQRNVFAAKYRPIISTYLSNSSYTGYSATAWYLLGDPQDVSVIEVAFLNGRQQPTVESADADFNTLGIQMRGYFDFGVAKQDYRGGVKSKGAA